MKTQKENLKNIAVYSKADALNAENFPAWKKYHRRHPHAVAFLLRGDVYMTSPIDDASAKSLNVHQIFGWNDSVIDYMKFVIEKKG